MASHPVFTPPPNWPTPPAGWQPPPGWQPDPSWPPPPPGWNFWQRPPRSWALDRAVADQPDEGWSIWLGIVPVLALVTVLGSEAAVGALTDWHPHGLTRYLAFAVLSPLHYVAAIAAMAILGRQATRRSGWRGVFGWGPWRLIDLPLGLAGAVVEFIGRIVIAVVLVVAVPALRGHTASNIDLHGRPVPEIVLLLILAVCVAPPAEELIFRGALLRSLMKRTGRFWPAALISSAVFAGLHLYEVHGLAAMVLLFASIAVFGLGQCLLVRWTGRLGTSITAHAVSNAAAALVTLAAHH
ncbi:MAG TPA: CPBP family intramembrane glutamic endopeptidase [Jatrophihabitans sp.]|nr:CPBP family intramembrane glutamic endopeptidase [Jatrophihabitans sp.]